MKIQKLKHFWHKHGATVLSLTGCASFVASYILCVKETNDTANEDTKTKIISHIPSALLGVGGIVSVCASNGMHKKHEASLLAACGTLKAYHSAYKQKVIEKCGEEEESIIEEEALSDTMLARDILAYHKLDLDIPDKKMLFKDMITGAEFVAYEREVMDAEYHINRNYILSGFATVEEYATFLGIQTESWMSDSGWVIDDNEVYWLDFTHKIIGKSKDGLDICCIYPDFVPSPEWLNGD